MSGRKGQVLTDKQEQFCHEYLIDLNGADAAIRAGYSAKGAKQIASENMQRPHVAARIAELKARRADRVGVDAAWVLRRLIEIDEMDVSDIMDPDGNILTVSEWPPAWRRTISALDVTELMAGAGDERKVSCLLKKIKWPDKLKNLELLGRHVTVGAFKETIDHNHKGEIRSVVRTIVDPRASK